MARSTDIEAELVAAVARYRYDPLGYIQFAFPWGQPGSALGNFSGPQHWQAETLLAIGAGLGADPQKLQVAIASGKGVGKAQCKETRVMTPRGWFRWGDLRPGDSVFAEDGSPTRVLQTHDQGTRPMARVTFDDGSSTVCDYDHLWKVMGRKERRNDRGAVRTDNWVVMTTQELIDKGLRFGGKLNARQFEIPTQGKVLFLPKELPIDPYLMGIWLGDGHKGQPAYSKPYPEVRAELSRRGFDVRPLNNGKNYVRGIKETVRGIPVMQLNSHARYVPEEYKTSAAYQRRDLLCGLLESDGECDSAGSIIFSSTSQTLAEDVIWLARSLGGKAQMQATVKAGRYKKDGETIECRPCWRATLALAFNPFRIAHKAGRWHKPEPRYFKRWIDRISPAGDGEAMCISVAHPAHCYQTNDFIVTHNSALISHTALWALSTSPDTRIILTAGTEPQLRTKTMPELSKWFHMLINKHWFHCPATAVYAADIAHEKTWRLDAVPWNANNPEAFAGFHNLGRRAVVMMDEASQIDDRIWDTTDGVMGDKDTEVLWLAYGNPTRNQGRFFDCFNRFSHRWRIRQIDSRKVSITDKDELQKLVDDYGEDSDYVRMMVRGQFPRVSSMQFISTEVVRLARKREALCHMDDALVLGVDVARFGDDQTVICPRKGRDARTIPWVKVRNMDTMQVAALVAERAERLRADAIHVDGGGVGGGVVDRLRQMGFAVRGIDFGSRADRTQTEADATRYGNKRSEMWGYAREWLKAGAVPDEDELERDLTGPLYGFRDSTKGSEILLEQKDHMKKRGLASPDLADALALTFAYPALPRQGAGGPHVRFGRNIRQAMTDYNPF